MYFEAKITRISYTLGKSCDSLAFQYHFDIAGKEKYNAKIFLISYQHTPCDETLLIGKNNTRLR